NADNCVSSVPGGMTELHEPASGPGRHDPMRARYRYLFEQSGEMKLLLSPKGTMLEVNSDCARTLGLDRVQLLGRSILEFVIAGDRNRLADMLTRTFRHEQSVAQEVEVEAMGGRRRIVFAPGHRDPLGSAQSGAVLVTATDI